MVEEPASPAGKEANPKSLQSLLLALNPVNPQKIQSRPTQMRHAPRLAEARMQAVKEETEELVVPDEFEENIKEVALFFLKLAVASVMVHHGQEKILSPNEFTKFTMDAYFGFLPGPHIYYTYAAGFVQWIAPIFVVLGVFSRLASASLVAVMAGAFLHSMLTSGLEGFPGFELGGLSSKLPFKVPAFHNYGFETPTLYIIIFAFLAIAGPGKLSLAQLLGWNDDKTLLGKLKQ
jgi:uncharacterized membrane protein YphA (DoxX/SURF4 family)